MQTTKPWYPNANGLPGQGPLPLGRTIKPGTEGGAVVQDWTNNRLRWACYMVEPAKESASVRRLVTALIAQRRTVLRTARRLFGEPALPIRSAETTTEATRREPTLRDDHATRLVQVNRRAATSATWV